MNISTVLAFGFEIFLPCRARNFLWETEFSYDTHISLQGLPLSFHPISLSLFLQYSSWNTDHHIFVCCWDIWHIPHTSWYSVLLSQNTQWTVTSHHFSKLTIFISVFRIFRQPDFSFLVCQFLNDQYQQPWKSHKNTISVGCHVICRNHYNLVHTEERNSVAFFLPFWIFLL